MLQSDIGVIFSSFDYHQGPIVVYRSNIDDVAELVAFKAITASLSGQPSDGGFINGESIIPIQEGRKIAFSYFFSIKDDVMDRQIRPSSISVVLSDKESFLLYQSAPELGMAAKLLAKNIQSDYKFPDILSANVKEEIDQLAAIVARTKAFLLPDVKDKAISLAILQKWQKNLDRLLEALTTYDRIALIAEKPNSFNAELDALRILAPHRSLRIDTWTTKITQECDVYCGPEELIKNLPPNMLYINLKKQKIENGEKNSFLQENIVSLIRKSSELEVISVKMLELHEKWLGIVNNFFNKLTLFLEKPNDAQRKVDVKTHYIQLHNDISESEMRLISQIMQERSPALTLRAKELLFGQTVLDTMLKTLITTLGPIGQEIMVDSLRELDIDSGTFSPSESLKLVSVILKRAKCTGMTTNNQLILGREILEQVDDFLLLLSKTV